MLKFLDSLFGKSDVQIMGEPVCYYDYDRCYTYETNEATGNYSNGKIIFVRCGC
jgi:hypothetical protein